MSKLRRIVDYKNLSNELIDKLDALYPDGYEDKDFVKFQNAQGDTISAIPLETDDAMFLVKLTTIVREITEDVEIEDPAILEEEAPSNEEQEKDEFKPEQEELKEEGKDYIEGYDVAEEEPYEDEPDDDEEPYDDDQDDDYNGKPRKNRGGSDYDEDY